MRAILAIAALLIIAAVAAGVYYLAGPNASGAGAASR